MKIKALLLLCLFFAAASCSKDEPIGDWNHMLDSTIGYDPGHGYGYDMLYNTPKGNVYCKRVEKDQLPVWLQDMTEDISNGYILKAGRGDELLYFVYDNTKDYGRHYDVNGNKAKDNPNLKEWILIYMFYPIYL